MKLANFSYANGILQGFKLTAFVCSVVEVRVEVCIGNPIGGRKGNKGVPGETQTDY